MVLRNTVLSRGARSQPSQEALLELLASDPYLCSRRIRQE
jgi:hypothetical protein